MAALSNTVARLKCPFHCDSPVSQAVGRKVPRPLSLQGLASSFRDCPCQRTSQIHPGPKRNDRLETVHHAGFPVRIQRRPVPFRSDPANFACANDFTFKMTAAWRGATFARRRLPVLSGMTRCGRSFSGSRDLPHEAAMTRPGARSRDVFMFAVSLVQPGARPGGLQGKVEAGRKMDITCRGKAVVHLPADLPREIRGGRP